ncbi:MAG: alpha/beta hydrolase, partial [Wenzhouxiangella sp.]
EGRFSLFAGLRDGTGAAKIDLRPGSEFLTALNARSWPESIPIKIIGGLLSEPDPAMVASLHALSEDLGQADMAEPLEAWWAETSEQIGDGVVSIQSLEFAEAPPPLLLPASHRGLLISMPLSEDAPPAIEPTVELLQIWIKAQRAPAQTAKPPDLTGVQ